MYLVTSNLLDLETDDDAAVIKCYPSFEIVYLDTLFVGLNRIGWGCSVTTDGHSPWEKQLNKYG